MEELIAIFIAKLLEDPQSFLICTKSQHKCDHISPPPRYVSMTLAYLTSSP